MEIVNLSEKYHHIYFHCLEDWSEDIKEAVNHKENWHNEMKDKGLRVKLAVEDDKVCGMIQYVPVEHSELGGKDLYFIKCIWVHGHKQGIGNQQRKGMGSALLEAAEEDIRSMQKKGVAAWGISLPFWMKASWFKKYGYKKVDKNGMAVLMWKPFVDDALPPQWVREKKRPQKVKGKVIVTSFLNGWCPVQNTVHERAKRASQEFGDKVEFQEIKTLNPDVFCEWGISDGLFVNGKAVRTGPPPSYEKIRKIIAKPVKKIK